MSRRYRPTLYLEHGILQRAMRILEESFHQAVAADEPFLTLRKSLKVLEDGNEFPFFDWAPIEIAFEHVLSKERTIQGAAYKVAMEITGLRF
jgi:hypothetical protein